MKTFKIFKFDSTTEIIQADKAEWNNKKDGLTVKFTAGKSSKKLTGISVLIEVMPEIVFNPNQNESQDNE